MMNFGYYIVEKSVADHCTGATRSDSIAAPRRLLSPIRHMAERLFGLGVPVLCRLR